MVRKMEQESENEQWQKKADWSHSITVRKQGMKKNWSWL